MNIITKTAIIGLLRDTKTATIAFKGLVTRKQVDKRRQAQILEVIKQVATYNELHPDEAIDILIKDGTIAAGTSTLILPAYPRTGEVHVKSRTYVVAGVTCDFTSIVPGSFISDGKSWQFMTTNGSVISVQK